MNEKNMDKDWIKAVTLLCIIAQNNADSMKQSVRYAEIMKKEYGLDAEKFQWIYDSWFRSGEIQEKYRIKDSVTGREQKLPLYHKGVDGMCRMLEEGIIDEKEFFEIFWETPYEILKENEKYTGFYPSLPGCIASAEGKDAYCFEEMDSVSILYVERKQYPGRVIFRDFLHIYK